MEVRQQHEALVVLSELIGSLPLRVSAILMLLIESTFFFHSRPRLLCTVVSTRSYSYTLPSRNFLLIAQVLSPHPDHTLHHALVFVVVRRSIIESIALWCFSCSAF